VIEAISGKTHSTLRGEYVDRFNTGRCTRKGDVIEEGLDILVMTAEVGSYGFNLAQRCFRSVQFKPWISASREDQALARVWRGGQCNPLYEHYVITDKRFPVEAHVMAMRDGRQAVATEMYSIVE